MGEVGIGSLIFLVLFLLLLALSIRLGKDMLEKELRVLKSELRIKEEKRAGFLRQIENIKREKLYLEKKLTILSRLYAITKEMSFDMRFDELFNSLKNFLEENFQLEKFKVVLFKHENDERLLDRVYEVTGESKNYIKPDHALRDLTDSIAESKKPAFFEDTLAIPLIARRRIISAILIENVKKEDYDKFLILAPQVALQIERIKLFDNVEKLSIMDGLTGTFLRRYLLERFEEEISRAQQAHLSLSFIMADLDYFKKCNDNFGHLVGDVVLKEVANILKKNVREIDLVARFGGEEFCVLLPEASKDGAYAVGERIRKTIEDCTIKAYDESIKITISMGVSSFPEDSKDLDELIENADKALYEAKKQGRNRICLASQKS